MSDEAPKAQKVGGFPTEQVTSLSAPQSVTQTGIKPTSDSDISHAQLVSDIIDASPCIAARFGKNSACMFASTGCQDAFGLGSQEILGRTLGDIVGQSDPRLCPCCDALTSAIAQGIRTECTCAVNLQGVQKTYLVMISPEKFDRAASNFADVMFVDISKCLDTFHSLKPGSIDKERFIGIVAHELRNPLSAISSGLKILAVTPPGAETAQIRAMMERQVAQLSRLVQDLLEMSRINEAKLTLAKTTVLLSDIISLAVETAQSSIKSGRHELRVQVPEDPIELHVDGSRIAQVISNLLDNSCKFTPEGGVITLQVVVKQEQLYISIRDNGVGIAPEHKDSIFRKFMQVDAASRRARGGLGLGLYLVKMIVESHGGAIEVFSDGHGQGSEFVVRLPTR